MDFGIPAGFSNLLRGSIQLSLTTAYRRAERYEACEVCAEFAHPRVTDRSAPRALRQLNSNRIDWPEALLMSRTTRDRLPNIVNDGRWLFDN
jgi:hypothetical protein